MLSLLQKLAERILIRSKPGMWIVIDLREDAIRLPDGTRIRREDIVAIDPERKVIIYRDPSGMIREARYA